MEMGVGATGRFTGDAFGISLLFILRIIILFETGSMPLLALSDLFRREFTLFSF